ncbi:conserved oligomeric Golgi complex component [Perkinsus chesapeaki]|uniref:Conserved oligomeric Golgi complex subunit 8 n=1 Tax=Perkinsus chesapeaki TaxID=330153 RepID=A0A7J6MSU8_PERCH|nr:conserved oligomeric Golgi complex component [Perkinsus chesapeaki]
MTTKEELEALKVAELKVKLKEAKLPLSGTKAVLVARLVEHYEKEEEDKGKEGDEEVEDKATEEDEPSEEDKEEPVEEKKKASPVRDKAPVEPAKAKTVESDIPVRTGSSRAPSSAAEDDANSCMVEAGSSAAAMSTIEASEVSSEKGKDTEKASRDESMAKKREESLDEDAAMQSPGESPRSEKEEEGEKEVIQTKSGKAIPRITWDNAGGGDSSNRNTPAEQGRSPPNRKRSLSGGEDSDHRRKVERARRFGMDEDGDERMVGKGEDGIELKTQAEAGGGETKEAPPMAKAMEKFTEMVEHVMHDAQLITAEDVLADERNADLLDLALEQFTKEEVAQMMLDVDGDIKREFKWRSEIRWPPSMFHGRFRRACRMAGVRGMMDERGGYYSGKGSWGKGGGGRWGEGDRREGPWSGGRSGPPRGRAAYFGHDDRAGIREPSPPLEGMDRMSSPTRLRGRAFSGGKGSGRDEGSGGFRPRQSWGRSGSGGGVWQHDDRAGGRSFDPASEPSSGGFRRSDDRRGFRSRSRSPLPVLQSNLPTELKNIVEDFIRENRLDERAASALLQRTTPDVLIRVLEMGRLTSPNHSRELMIRLRDIGGGGGGFRRSGGGGGSPFSGGRRRQFSPPPASRRRSRSRSDDRAKRPASPPAYRRPHRGRHAAIAGVDLDRLSGFRGRIISSFTMPMDDEGSSSGGQWTGVESEDVDELTREYRRKTQNRVMAIVECLMAIVECLMAIVECLMAIATTDPYLALLYPDKDPSEYPDLPLAGCAMDYLPTLCANYTVERVNAEASDLDVDIARTNDEMESLAVNNYKAFISAAKVLRRVDKDMDKAREDLSGIGEDLGPLQSSLNTLRTSRSKELKAKRAALRQVTGHSGIHELLELPALIDATIRNKLYMEALELLSFADRTLRALTVESVGSSSSSEDEAGRQGGGVPSIVVTLKGQVETQRSHLLSSLTSQLASPQLHLPQAVPVVNHLRRVLPTLLRGGSSEQVEMIIRVAFLTQRSSDPSDLSSTVRLRCQYADQQKDSIEAQANSTTGATLLSSLRAGSDLLRSYVFDTAMQYRSLFSPPKGEVDPLAVWMSTQVSWFVSMVSASVAVPQDPSEELPFDASQLASLYRYCSNASTTLARVSCAFMPLVEPLLDAYLQHFICTVCLDEIAMDDFTSEMDKYHWVPSTALIQGPEDYNLTDVADRSSLIIYLTRHRPLAVFFNDVTVAMNELRQCPALHLAEPVAKSLQGCLDSVAKVLSDASGKVSPVEQEELQRMERNFVEIVIPVVSQMYSKIFGEAARSFVSMLAEVAQELQVGDSDASNGVPPPMANSELMLAEGNGCETTTD